jgi:hypothetical protein
MQVAATDAQGLTLADYRSAIRSEWLPIVGRKRLTSFEYTLTEEWWKAGIPIGHMLRAIRDCKRRATGTLYSIGVIRADLERIARDQAKLQVGNQQINKSQKTDWRADYLEALEDVASSCTDPELAATWRELIASLPGLDQSEADRRWKEIAAR